MTYSQRLKDPRWQRKRLEIMQRDNFTCTKCGDDKSTLNVHHEQYAGDPWEIANEHLVTLCESCHRKVEALKKAPALSTLQDAIKQALANLEMHGLSKHRRMVIGQAISIFNSEIEKYYGKEEMNF